MQARRQIVEAWRAEIKQAATARGDVNAKAELVQSIDDLLPPRARAAFEQAMRQSPDWVSTGEEYRSDVHGGVIVYRPDSGELKIEVKLSVALEAVATATLVASGEVTDEVTAEATGTYYSDGYLGRTKEAVSKEVQAAADAQAEELAQQKSAGLKHRAEEASRHELNRRREEAETEARRSAEEQLTHQILQRQSDLDEQAERELEAVQEATLRGIFQLVATGYSIALQEYAAEHGENLQVSEDDGVISIQFELER